MRRIIWGMVATLVALIGFGCAAPTPSPTPTSPAVVAATPTKAPTATPTKRPITKFQLSIGSLGLVYAPSFIAQAKGWWLEDSLDVEIISTGSGAKSFAAMAGGSTQAGMSSFVELVKAISEGLPAVGVGIISRTATIDLAIRKDVLQQRGITEKSSLVEKGKALKGLRIAITSAGADSDLLVRIYAANYGGLDPDRDLEILPMGADAALAAIQKGEIDGINISSPAPQRAVMLGLASIMISPTRGDVPEAKDAYALGVHIMRSFGDQNPDLVTALIKGIYRALEFISREPVVAKNFTKEMTYFRDLDRDTFEATWEGTASTWPPEPTMLESGIKRRIDLINMSQTEKINLTFDQIATNRFVEQAKKELGR